METVLDQIRQFADKCHGDQMRRYVPDRYIVHPVRVMKMCKTYTTDIATLGAALLHDVLEDTPVTKQELMDFLLSVLNEMEANKTLAMVVELTDIYTKEEFPQWNRRVRKDKEAERLSKISAGAQTVKYADIIDNTPEITEKDADFAKRFIPEYKHLLKKMTKGNPELYRSALHTVNECMMRLNLVRRQTKKSAD